MSGTIQASVVKDSASATNNLTLDTGGNATVGNTLVMGSSFLRNRIINGNMQVWQRGTSFPNITYSYSADRWAGNPYASGSTQTLSQSTSVPTGFQYSLKVQRNSGSTSATTFSTLQTIESVNCYDLAGQSVTISFYAKAGANYSATSNILGVQVWTGTVADQGGATYSTWTGAAQPIIGSAILTTSWQRFSFTGTIGSGVLEVAPVFFYTAAGTAGADDAFYITGVQFEVGTVATPFERQIYSTQLEQCQRYYYRITSQAAGDYFVNTAFAVSTTLAFGFSTFPVQMRTKPTALEQSGTAADYNVVRCGAGTNTNCSAVPTFGVANLNNAETVFTVASGLVNGGAGAIQSNNTSAYLGWSAEL